MKEVAVCLGWKICRGGSGWEGKEWKSEVEARLADMFGVVTGLTINDVPKKNKKGKRVA